MSTVEAGTKIPVIDISSYLKGENIGATVSEIRNACVNVGFFRSLVIRCRCR